jgi:ADP-ribose pyrophosphatase
MRDPREPAVPGVPPDPPAFEPFEVLRSDRIYDSDWVGLRRDVLRLRDGSEQEHHVVEIAEAVVVVPVLADGRIVLIGHYRHATRKTSWEVPAGRIGAGETPRGTAERELAEEAGFRAGRLIGLPGFYPTNGISAHYSHTFCALDCVELASAAPEESEQILVRTHTRAQVEALLDAGRIEGGFSAIALMYYLRLG